MKEIEVKNENAIQFVKTYSFNQHGTTEKITLYVISNDFTTRYSITGKYFFSNRRWEKFEGCKALIDLLEKSNQPIGLLNAVYLAKNYNEAISLISCGFMVGNDFARLKATW